MAREVKTSCLSRQCSCEQRLAAKLDERQPAGAQGVKHVAIEIMHVDAQSRLGERQNQRNADMTPAADNREVTVFRRYAAQSCGAKVGRDSRLPSHRAVHFSQFPSAIRKCLAD